MSTRSIVYAAMIAAVYAIITLVLAPISYGPLQLRVAGMLVPLALVNPVYGLGLAIGLGMANLGSPFGPWDFVLMPVALYLACLGGYRLRRFPWLALPLMAAWSAVSVAWFPLHIGGGLPFCPTALWIFVSLIVLYVPGYLLLRKTILWDAAPLRATQAQPHAGGEG